MRPPQPIPFYLPFDHPYLHVTSCLLLLPASSPRPLLSLLSLLHVPLFTCPSSSLCRSYPAHRVLAEWAALHALRTHSLHPDLVGPATTYPAVLQSNAFVHVSTIDRLSSCIMARINSHLAPQTRRCSRTVRGSAAACLSPCSKHGLSSSMVALIAPVFATTDPAVLQNGASLLPTEVGRSW